MFCVFIYRSEKERSAGKPHKVIGPLTYEQAVEVAAASKLDGHIPFICKLFPELQPELESSWPSL